jgi:protease-4
VDLLGDEQAAIARAAELAGLSDYGVKHIEAPLTTQEMLLRALTGNVHIGGIASAGGWLEVPPLLSPLLRRAGDAWLLLQGLNDPGHSYALCPSCLAAP